MPRHKNKAIPLSITGGNTVDIFRSKRIANIFFFFVSAAKASLFPFLTIYFRLLGLSPLQTAIIFASRATVTAIFVPFWLKISYLCNQKKVLMLFSIVILITSHLTLTAVPPADKDDLLIWCPKENETANIVAPPLGGMEEPTTPAPNTTSAATIETVNIFMNGTAITNSPLTTNAPLINNGTTPVVINTINAGANSTTTVSTTPGANIPPAKDTTTATTGFGITSTSSTSTTPTSNVKTTPISILSNSTQTPTQPSAGTPKPIKRAKRSLLSGFSVREKLGQWQSKVYSIHNRTFILVLLIVVFGEVFSCAAEKFADDAWFTLLDSVDDVEKYGSHKYWSCVAYIFYAVIVAVVVDTRECFLPVRIHHFMIHFYVFIFLLVFAFFTGFFYPFYPRDKPSRPSSRKKAKILCSDLRSAIFVFTIFLMGCLNATITCFLFWLVQDKGGSEIQMGVSVMIASISELFMLVFAKQIIRRLGIPFTVIMGILAMAVRLLYFSFLWTPWAVVGIEVLYGLSNTALWQAISAHPDFSLNIIARRSTQNIFFVLYYGLGASVGSILAGYGYAYKTLPVVYQSAAIVATIWAILFAIAQKCLPKPTHVKYARLLGEDDESPSDSDEDDWLEMALKNH